MTIDACKVLMIFPRFNADSFWNYRATCELTGARYPAAPLGLITVAALLPQSWEVRLVNRNTETLTEADLEWADLAMTGGMLFQQPDSLRIIEMCRARGKPVVVGGPDVTSTRISIAARTSEFSERPRRSLRISSLRGGAEPRKAFLRRRWGRPTSRGARHHVSIC
jgi:hypothetical protein